MLHSLKFWGPDGSVSYVVESNSSYKPITNTAWVRARLCKLQKGCTRLTAASDKVYQLLAHGRWFSPGTPASSTTKTGRHDILVAEILLKVALKHQNSKSNHWSFACMKGNDLCWYGVTRLIISEVAIYVHTKCTNYKM